MPSVARADRPQAGRGRRRSAGAGQCVARGNRGPRGGLSFGGRVRPGGGPGRPAAGEEAGGLGRVPRQAHAVERPDRPRVGCPVRGRARPGRGPKAGPGRIGEHRRAEGGTQDVDRGPAGRPQGHLRAFAPRPLPQQRGRARAGPVRRPGDRPLAGAQLPVVPPVRATRGHRGPGLAARVRAGPAGPGRGREDLSRRHHGLPRAAGPQPGRRRAGPAPRRGLGRAARDARRPPRSHRRFEEATDSGDARLGRPQPGPRALRSGSAPTATGCTVRAARSGPT